MWTSLTLLQVLPFRRILFGEYEWSITMHTYKLCKLSKDSCLWEDVFEVESTQWWLGCQAGP